MSITLTGTYDGTSIWLDEKVDLEANTRVRVTVEPVPSPSSGRSFLDTAQAMTVSGPADWATNIEKYLHGPLAGDD
ncbi:MAG TPA: hypothetical protein VEG34_18155 [Thermoanaerobaculia bacterium]|nr:hypothetical protein [Thermoanaerobaculia bacterium]